MAPLCMLDSNETTREENTFSELVEVAFTQKKFGNDLGNSWEQLFHQRLFNQLRKVLWARLSLHGLQFHVM